MESKNFKCGKKVLTINHLYKLAVEHKSVFDVDLGLKAARVIMNQQAWKLKKKLARGGVYTAVKK